MCQTFKSLLPSVGLLRNLKLPSNDYGKKQSLKKAELNFRGRLVQNLAFTFQSLTHLNYFKKPSHNVAETQLYKYRELMHFHYIDDTNIHLKRNQNLKQR